MRRSKCMHWFLIALAVAVTFELSGCSSLRKKFTRKKKSQEKEVIPQLYRVQEYDIKPSMELYQKHYVYWRNWHTEIIGTLGANSKSDKMCLEQMIGNLSDMKAMLTDEKGDKLDKHIQRLAKVRSDLIKQTLSDANKTRIRRVLEKEYKLIKIEFSYNKMASFIREDFRRDQAKDGELFTAAGQGAVK